MTKLDEFVKQADVFGLILRGGFYPQESDKVPDITQNEKAKTLLLFGNAGSSIWPCFSTSAEHCDGEANPLDRWSTRIGTQLATQWRGQALFPFGGPPYQPFIGWAKKAENLSSSRLGMLIHPTYGLWHAYRFAVALPYEVEDLVDTQQSESATDEVDIPCNQCINQPCLQSCPVGAFKAEEYDVETCFQYLKQHPESSCHSRGCQARLACPEGKDFRYDKAHGAFHMSQFYQSLTRRFAD